jgi:hypothetical protein
MTLIEEVQAILKTANQVPASEGQPAMAARIAVLQDAVLRLAEEIDRRVPPESRVDT